MIAKGVIDSTKFLQSDPVFLYSGEKDTVVANSVVHQTQAYYEHYLTNGSITTQYDISSEHCYPTVDYGNACDVLGEPYISACGYDGAYESLKALYGPELKKGVSAREDGLMTWDQTQFATGDSLGDTGYIYVPTACASGASCGLHIQFHGCDQTLADVGTDYVSKLGLNEVGEANNIVILYPQVAKSDAMPMNPQGCWSWWYGGSNYALQTGTQMRFVRDVQRVVMGQ
jgi:hypothetical protein